MADKTEDKTFLHRWSARKHAVRQGDDVVRTAEAAVVGTSPELTVEDGGDPAAQGQPVEDAVPAVDLPDVESLDGESDYTAFLGDNVPEDLAKMALRKLWRSDPVFANLDGLNDYDDDFSKLGMVTEAVKTVYKVGKGYLSDDDAAERELAEDESVGTLPEDAVAQTDSETRAVDEGLDRDEVPETAGTGGETAYLEPLDDAETESTT